MKNMNERDDVNIYFDAGSNGYVVQLMAIGGVWNTATVCGECETAHGAAAKMLGVPWLEPMRFSQTYEVVTPESAAIGETDDKGYDWQDSPETFKALVKRLKSDYAGAFPVRDAASWITAEGDTDYRDCSVRNISLHPVNERAKRWWPKALRAAGLLH